MNLKEKRILIFGAGVIGSLYALRFAQSGLDVTLLARGKRLEVLKRDGLRYNDNGSIKQISIKTIEKLENDDIYDFIFVPVRYDQAESALSTIKNNRSKTIVTMTNTVEYTPWIEIVGDRLIPGFPGAGGDIKDGVLYAQFGSQQGTIFGEINGQMTERVKELVKIFEAADLHYEIPEDILAFHISHAAIAVVTRQFYENGSVMDIETARSESTLRKLATELKQNIHMVEQAGIQVIPPETKSMGELPEKDIINMYLQMLSDDFTIDVLLGNHIESAISEITALNEAFHKKISARL